MPERPVLPAEVINGYKRLRVLEAIAGLGAAQPLETVKVADIVKQARIARKTFYDLFGGAGARDTAIAETLRWAGSSLLAAGADGGLESVIGWAEAHPAAVRFALFCGPSIGGGQMYGQLLEDAAANALGDTQIGLAIVGGAVAIIAAGVREGGELRDLAEAAVKWASQYPPPDERSSR